MHDNRRCARDLTFLALILSLSLVIGALQIGVDAHLSGHTGGTIKGCKCHTSTPSSGVNVSITGQPAEYTPITKYSLQIKVSGGPSPGGISQGGFDLGVSGGFLSVPSGSTDVQIASGEATHTQSGAKKRQWNVDWTSPTQGSGPVTFNAAGMSSDGDGTESGDLWNTASYTFNEKKVADTTVPSISISAPTEAQRFPFGTAQVSVIGTSSDNVGVTTVEVSKDGINWSPATGTTGWTATIGVSAGSNLIRARAKDAANNIGYASVNISVDVTAPDTQAPSITIAQPTEGGDFPSGTVLVNISGTAMDNVGVVKVEVSSNGVSWSLASGTSSWSAKLTVQTGGNTLRARATDAAMNSMAATVNITIKTPTQDMNPPTISIVDPASGMELVANTTQYLAKGKASDDIGLKKVEVSMDGSTWSLATGTENWSAPISVKAGPNFLQARATDTSENTVLASVSFTVVVPPPPADKTPPVLSIGGPQEAEVFPFGTKSVQVHGTVTDNKGVEEVRVSTDGAIFNSALGNTTWSYNLAVLPGHYKITVVAEDLSGNLATRSANITVLADTTPPLIIITSHSNGAILEEGMKRINLTGQALDNNRTKIVEVSKDNKTWLAANGTNYWFMHMPLSPGKNTFYVRATDEDGNTAYSKVEVTLSVEKQNLWYLHVILLSFTFAIALVVFVLGWRIRRDKTKRTPAQKMLRRKLHIYIGPVFTAMMVIGLIDGFWNRLTIRGIIFTSIHGYLAVACTVPFLIGSIIGHYMAWRRPTDILRRVHLVLNIIGTVLLLLSIIYGVLMVKQLHLLSWL